MRCTFHFHSKDLCEFGGTWQKGTSLTLPLKGGRAIPRQDFPGARLKRVWVRRSSDPFGKWGGNVFPVHLNIANSFSFFSLFSRLPIRSLFTSFPSWSKAPLLAPKPATWYSSLFGTRHRSTLATRLDTPCVRGAGKKKKISLGVWHKLTQA